MNGPLYEPDEPANYTLEIVSKITGMPSPTILHYQEAGFIRSSRYDDETVRTLRRIEHLQDDLGLSESGLRLILDLTDEVERLRAELRARR